MRIIEKLKKNQMSTFKEIKAKMNPMDPDVPNLNLTQMFENENLQQRQYT